MAEYPTTGQSPWGAALKAYIDTEVATKADDAHVHETGHMRVVVHGSTAGTARPTADAVYWIGTVEPTNAVDGDLWTGGAA